MFQDSRSVICGELSSGERTIWHGRPVQGLCFRASDLFLVPFSLLWGGFAIFWEYSVVTSDHAPVFFALWGIPFVCVGLFLIFGRFFVDAYCRERTFYAVTSERVIIVSGVFSRRVQTLNLKNLSEMTYAEGSGGRGTISFGTVPFPFAQFHNSSWPGSARHTTPQFELIDGAKKVYDIIRETQRGGHAT